MKLKNVITFFISATFLLARSMLDEGSTTMTTIAHEVGHALGFQHEQARPDRDQHVKVLYQNIKKDMFSEFDIENEVMYYGVPYDLKSLMHYGLDDFTKNGKNTMVPLDIRRTFDIGQDVSLSFYDLKMANLMYNCSDNCLTKPNCQNDGYVDQYCTCQCKEGFSGPLCETRVYVPGPICGGELARETTITSPNYPENYAKGNRCIWLFKAPEGKQVKAYFSHFDLSGREGETGFCAYDYLEVRTDDMDDGKKRCGKELRRKAIISNDNQMALLFKANYGDNTGFKAVVTFE